MRIHTVPVRSRIDTIGSCKGDRTMHDQSSLTTETLARDFHATPMCEMLVQLQAVHVSAAPSRSSGPALACSGAVCITSTSNTPYGLPIGSSPHGPASAEVSRKDDQTASSGVRLVRTNIAESSEGCINLSVGLERWTGETKRTQ
jgi:hypothetical protein